jgi:hypothetical protein
MICALREANDQNVAELLLQSIHMLKIFKGMTYSECAISNMIY